MSSATSRPLPDIPPAPARSPLTLLHYQESSSASDSPAPSKPRESDKKPFASIGVLTDIQYSHVDNGSNFHRTEIRYYRHSIRAAERAFQEFVDISTKSGVPCSIVLHLGDLIDGMNKRLGTTEQAMTDVLPKLPRPATVRTDSERQAEMSTSTKAPFPSLSVYHLTGNHEVANASRSVWASALGMGDLAKRSIEEVAGINAPITLKQSLMFPAVEVTADSTSSTPAPSGPAASGGFTDDSPLYYSFDVGHYKFLMLDAFDVALLGRPADHPVVAQARAVLLKHRDPNHPLYEKFHDPIGETYHMKRFVAFNGGIGEKQLRWIHQALKDAEQKRQYVILCSHVPFEPRATQDYLQIWNQNELLEIVAAHPQIIACLHGHDHRGGHYVDETTGVTHHVFEAILTAPDDRSSHGLLDLYQDRIELRACDLMVSATINVPQRAKDFYKVAPSSSSVATSSEAQQSAL